MTYVKGPAQAGGCPSLTANICRAGPEQAKALGGPTLSMPLAYVPLRAKQGSRPQNKKTILFNMAKI